MDFSDLWRNYTFVAFDTETSGKYPLVAEVVEVAAVKWKNGQIIDEFQSLVKPRELMSDFVIGIHHITNEMAAEAPLMNEVLPKFNSFIQGGILIAHHAAFDMGFLALEYEKLGMPLPQEPSIDTCLLARKTFPNSMNHRLATLVNLLGVKMGQAHRALDDSRACLGVGLKTMQELGAESTLDFIFQVQGGPFVWRRFSMNGLVVQGVSGQEAARALVEGSKHRLVLEIVYTGGSMPGQARRITPLGLVRNAEGDYVVGLCHRENCEKRFYLNRILSAKILD